MKYGYTPTAVIFPWTLSRERSPVGKEISKITSFNSIHFIIYFGQILKRPYSRNLAMNLNGLPAKTEFQAVMLTALTWMTTTESGMERLAVALDIMTVRRLEILRQKTD